MGCYVLLVVLVSLFYQGAEMRWIFVCEALMGNESKVQNFVIELLRRQRTIANTEINASRKVGQRTWCSIGKLVGRRTNRMERKIYSWRIDMACIDGALELRGGPIK